MEYITHHKGVGKLKLWKCVKDINAHYAALLANRNIDASDLDVYQVNVKIGQLKSKKVFNISGDYIITQEETLDNLDVIVNVPYKGLTSSELDAQDQQYKDNVAFNNTKEAEMQAAIDADDEAAYNAAKDAMLDIPDVAVTRNDLVPVLRDLQTIPVTKVI